MKYYKKNVIRCKCCGDILEVEFQKKTDSYVKMIWCKCGKVGLNPAASMYRIAGFPELYEDCSIEDDGELQ